MTVYGVSTDPNEIVTHRQTYGTMNYCRYFYGTKALSWATGPLNKYGDYPQEIPVISFDMFDQEDFELFADGADSFTNNGCYVIYRHEPEKDLRSGALVMPDLVETYSAMREIVAAYPAVKLASAANLYQLHHGFDWHILQPLMALCDVVGVDCYSGDEYAVKNHYATSAEMFDLALDMAAWAGRPLAVPEIGVRLATDKDDNRRADVVRGYVEYMSTENVQWASYFCNPNNNYHLTEPQTLRVWQTAVAVTQ